MSSHDNGPGRHRIAAGAKGIGPSSDNGPAGRHGLSRLPRCLPPPRRARKNLGQVRPSRTARSLRPTARRSPGHAPGRAVWSGRGIGIHSLRKTAINDAIRNGATMHEVREFAGEDAEVAARRIQIRVTGSAKRLFQKPGEVPVFQGFSRPGPIFETVSKPPN
jgi:hypothetical protein